VASAAFEEKYVTNGKVKFVYHDFPLNIHPNAIPAAQAARCAGDQNAYWQMHDMLFTNQDQWATLSNPIAQFASYAGQLKLDQGSFSQCLTSKTHEAAVLKARDASEQLGLPGTPSFAVNGKVVDATGAQTINEILDRVQVAVDAALAGT
jgi:protein-disulfide isomerase